MCVDPHGRATLCVEDTQLPQLLSVTSHSHHKGIDSPSMTLGHEWNFEGALCSHSASPHTLPGLRPQVHTPLHLLALLSLPHLPGPHFPTPLLWSAEWVLMDEPQWLLPEGPSSTCPGDRTPSMDRSNSSLRLSFVIVVPSTIQTYCHFSD